MIIKDLLKQEKDKYDRIMLFKKGCNVPFAYVGNKDYKQFKVCNYYYQTTCSMPINPKNGYSGIIEENTLIIVWCD